MRDYLLLCSFFFLINYQGISQSIKTDKISYLALGDSYTIGQSVSVDQRWPNQLATQLETKHGISFENVDIIAQTGWRTDDLINAIQTQQPDSSYNLVSLLIGVNNFYQGRSEEQYVREFDYLLQTAIALVGGDHNNVFVVSIPDYAYTPFGNGSNRVSQQTDRYNYIGDSISSIYQVQFHNITPISRQGLAKPDLVAGDNLHPSGKQYGLWVEQIINEMKISSILATRDSSKKREVNYLIDKDTLEIINVDNIQEGIIFNTEGQVILEFDSRLININGLDKGIYILSIQSEKGLWSKKIRIK